MLLLLRGIPGAGKSTLAAYFEKNNESVIVIEADQYFMKGNKYQFDPSKLRDAHEDCQKFTRIYLNEGFDVIVSNTSTTEKEVETYRKIAQEYDVPFFSCIVENRHGGKNIHDVPDEKIQQMRNRFSIKL